MLRGLDSLVYRHGGGRPEKLTPTQKKRRVELLDAGPLVVGFETACWNSVIIRVRAGSRLQVDIVSSNFPRRARNTNSGHPVLANDCEADIRVATNTVYHAAATPSFVEMSILSG